MILQALYQYYQRLLGDPQSGVSRPGYSKAKVSFALVLGPEGQLLNVIDLRDERKGRPVPRQMDVPEQVVRSSGIAANFLCDNSGYVLGMDAKGKPERTAATFDAFRKTHERVVGDATDPGLLALSRFLKAWDPKQAGEHPPLQSRLEDILKGGNLVFRLDGDSCYVHERPAARQAWENYKRGASADITAQCLVTGERTGIARTHSKIKGVSGASTSGASLVSFNIASFTSYGKEQNYNAPIGEPAAFAYTTALNHLLSDDRHRLQIGDATTVFWAERESLGENLLAAWLDPPQERSQEDNARDRPRQDPATTRLILDTLRRARDGHPVSEAIDNLDPDIRFFILGLSPNQARLSVRFWFVDTLGHIAERVGRHYADLQIERQFPGEPEFISVWRVLRELAVLGESKNIPHTIEAALVRAVLMGEDYPQALLPTLLGRVRADHEANYVRAATLKACLLRNARRQNRTLPEVTMTLNEQSTHPGYRLGRLFAVLEKVQQAASPGIQATIRDRYFSSASATPAIVFPVLLRLAQHHVAKAEYGRFSDQTIEQILAGMDRFPQRLSLEDQGLFMLGYYHQRNAFFHKSTKDKE